MEVEQGAFLKKFHRKSIRNSFVGILDSLSSGIFFCNYSTHHVGASAAEEEGEAATAKEASPPREPCTPKTMAVMEASLAKAEAEQAHLTGLQRNLTRIYAVLTPSQRVLTRF
jgi:hypothetical protein